MKTFRQFFTEQQSKKTVVFAYGRFNPPTTAHNMLFEKVIEAAKTINADYYIVPSHSTKPPNKNPLALSDKIEIIKHMLPDSSRVGAFGTTYIATLQKLQEMGYTDVVQLAGSDRIPEFTMLVNKYNGKPDQTGQVVFNFNVFEFVSAGERDPDSEGVEGMSASKLRQLAAEGNIEEFKDGMATSVPDKLKVKAYNVVRKTLGNK
jgi:hypothetical protein